MDGTLYVSNVGGAAGNDHRLAFGCHVNQCFDPVDFAGASLECRNIRFDMLNGVEVVGRGEEVDTDFVAFLFQDRRPALGDGCGGVDFGDGFFPRCLMADLGIHVCEAIFRDDLGRLKMLELGCVGAGIFGEFDEHLRSIQVAVVIGGDVGDEIGGMIHANGVIVDLEFHVFLRDNYADLLIFDKLRLRSLS